MKLKIGVMGSATGKLAKTHRKIAYELGCAIAEQGCITITGACPGLPLEAAKGAHAKGGLVVGISPALSEKEHVEKYRSPTRFHDVLIFTGSGLMGREVVNIRSSDIVIIMGGGIQGRSANLPSLMMKVILLVFFPVLKVSRQRL